MFRLLLAASVLAPTLASCADFECQGEGVNTVCPDDDRPKTLEYIVTTILRPNCANAQCHSGPVNRYDYRFDTLEHAQYSMTLGDGRQIVFPGDSASSTLYTVLIRETTPDGLFPRMPYDEPLPGPDIALIKVWIDSGADGLVVP